MSAVLDRAKAHFGADEKRSIEIPEWGEKGKPLVAFYYRATVRDISAANKAAEGDPTRFPARMVALKLLDDSGTRLFTQADGAVLESSADPNVLARLSLAIAGTTQSLDDVEKN